MRDGPDVRGRAGRHWREGRRGGKKRQKGRDDRYARGGRRRGKKRLKRGNDRQGGVESLERQGEEGEMGGGKEV